MAEPTYRWSYPAEWLLEKCQTKAQEGDTAYLMGVINAVVPPMDSDALQDIFQSEMDDDGYFAPLRKRGAK